MTCSDHEEYFIVEVEYIKEVNGIIQYCLTNSAHKYKKWFTKRALSDMISRRTLKPM